MKCKRLQIISLITLLITGCNINNPVAPRWDVSATIPIVNKEYLMSELIEDESENLFHYNEGINKDVIYFSESHKIDRIKFEDRLKIDRFSKTITEEIGILKIESDTVHGYISSSELGLNPSSRVVVPPATNKKVYSDLSEPGNFLQARFKNGSFDLIIRNNFTSDVNITISNISLTNIEDGNIIASHTGEITIPPSQSAYLSNLKINTGIYVKNRLKLETILSTSGSNGKAVQIPENFLTVTAITKNLEVTEATAKFPEQDFITVNGKIKIGEKNERISRAVISNGTLDLKLTNNTELDAEIHYRFDNLKTGEGKIFEGSAFIASSKSQYLFDNKSLAGYTLDAGSTLLEELSYTINYRIISDNKYKTIKSSDNAKADLAFSELTFEEFKGYIAPFEFDPERTSFSFDVGKDKIDFKELFLSNPIISLKLNTTAEIKFLLNGKLKLYMPDGTVKNFNLNDKTLNTNLITPSTDRIYLNGDSISAFIEKFNAIPDSAVIEISGTVNPYFEYLSVKSSDYIEGELQAEIPLDFSLQYGEYSDSIDLDLTEDERDLLKDVKYLEANLIVENGLPVNMSLTGKLYDAAGNFLTYFPPAEFQDTIITIKGATTDNKGFATSPAEVNIKVMIDSTASAKIASAEYMRIKINFGTNSESKPVKVRSSDTIKIRAFGVSKYNIEPEND
ncbi:hypothetical protein [Melioribacter sp. OK-6-Me]|uniref:hypothetical protein n=1 Tax=unclassified Melioribacter TaxID=2627329 RepID=UPI003ED9E43F